MQEMQPDLRVVDKFLEQGGLSELREREIAAMDIRTERTGQERGHHGQGPRPCGQGRACLQSSASQRQGRGLNTVLLALDAAEMTRARRFVMMKWRERAEERGEAPPEDLSRSCKYGSLFMQRLFGGAITGNYQHQFNIIDERIVDLSDDAADVRALVAPYRLEPELFETTEHRVSMRGCRLRVDAWVAAFRLLHAAE
jgi:hypothetical protein